MSGQIINIWFTPLTHPEDQLSAILSRLEHDFLHEDLASNVAAMDWDASDQDWVVSTPYEDDTADLAEWGTARSGFTLSVGIVSIGFEMPASIHFFRPAGNLAEPLVMQIQFSTIVDRNLDGSGKSAVVRSGNSAAPKKERDRA